MTKRLGLGVILLVAACGGKKADDRPADKPASGATKSGGSGAGTASGPPAWKLESRPVELPCGNKPLAIPAAAPTAAAAERPLPRAEPIAGCRDLASIRAACQCLSASVGTWGKTAGL